MALLPSLDKTYEFNVNHVLNDTRNWTYNIRQAAWEMKNSWLNWTVGAATCWGSSDKTNWSNTGTDYLVDWTKWLAGTPGSWIVLNMFGGGQLLMACGTSYDHAYIQYSPGGLFTGGGATTLPTATDGYFWVNNNDWWFDAGTAQRNGTIHFIHSTDGDVELVFLTDSAVVRCFMMFLRPQDTVDNWVTQHVSYCYSYSAGGRLTNAYLGQTQDVWKMRTPSGIWVDSFATAQSVNREAITERAELSVVSWTGGVPMSPMGFGSYIAGARGRHGWLPDIYQVHDTLNNGDTLEENPSSPTYSWAVFESLVVPWAGVTPIVT